MFMAQVPKTSTNGLPGKTHLLRTFFNCRFQRMTELIGFPFFKNRRFDDIVRWLYQPTDPASLGVTRALFGE